MDHKALEALKAKVLFELLYTDGGADGTEEEIRQAIGACTSYEELCREASFYGLDQEDIDQL